MCVNLSYIWNGLIFFFFDRSLATWNCRCPITLLHLNLALVLTLEGDGIFELFHREGKAIRIQIPVTYRNGRSSQRVSEGAAYLTQRRRLLRAPSTRRTLTFPSAHPADQSLRFKFAEGSTYVNLS